MATDLRTSLYGNYLILRFINPAIAAPEAHGLLQTPPELPARTTLKHVAKLLQAAANGALRLCHDPLPHFLSWDS